MTLINYTHMWLLVCGVDYILTRLTFHGPAAGSVTSNPSNPPAYGPGDVLYSVLYVCVSCFGVRGCVVLRRYIYDMFSIVNVYLDHLKFCVVCIDGGRYVYCSECNVVSNECNEPTSCPVQPIGTHVGGVGGERKRCILFTFCFRFSVNGCTHLLRNKHVGK